MADMTARRITTRTSRVTAIAVLALGLSACPSSTETTTAKPSPNSTVSSGDERLPSLAAPMISTPWGLVSAEGSALRLRVYGGSCITFDHLEVSESADGVLVTAVSVDGTPPPEANTPCTGELIAHEVAHQLRAPLTSRALLHAPVSDAWNGPKVVVETGPASGDTGTGSPTPLTPKSPD